MIQKTFRIPNLIDFFYSFLLLLSTVFKARESKYRCNRDNLNS